MVVVEAEEEMCFGGATWGEKRPVHADVSSDV